MMMMICLPPQGTPPTHSSRYGPQHTQHTASTAATPHYPQGRRQTPADAPTPLKRSMLTPFGGPRPRFGAKARERWFTRSNGSDKWHTHSEPLPPLLTFPLVLCVGSLRNCGWPRVRVGHSDPLRRQSRRGCLSPGGLHLGKGPPGRNERIMDDERWVLTLYMYKLYNTYTTIYI